MTVRKAVDPLRRLISGSFVQLDHWDDREGSRFQQELRALSPDHWRRMLQDMAAVGIDTLVFQQGIDARNGMDDIRAYYPSGHWRVPDWMRGKPLLYSEIVDEAERLGMTVIHGIYAMHWPGPLSARRPGDRACRHRRSGALRALWTPPGIRRLVLDLRVSAGQRLRPRLPAQTGAGRPRRRRLSLHDRALRRPRHLCERIAGYRRRHHRLSGYRRTGSGTRYFRPLRAGGPAAQSGTPAVPLRNAAVQP